MPHHFSHATTWSPLEQELCAGSELNVRMHQLRIMPTCSALSVPSQCHNSHLTLCAMSAAGLFDISASCLRRELQSYQGPPPAHSSFLAPGHMPRVLLAAPRLNPTLHTSKVYPFEGQG